MNDCLRDKSNLKRGLLTDYLTVFSLQVFTPHFLPLLFIPEHAAEKGHYRLLRLHYYIQAVLLTKEVNSSSKPLFKDLTYFILNVQVAERPVNVS